MDISGGIDLFWLEGGLRISAEEQIKFLIDLYKNNLNFSKRSMDILKKIMIYGEKDNFLLRAKTGWGNRFENQIGWFVGYIEKDFDVYFFAINLETDQPEEGLVSRKEIVFEILVKLKILNRSK